MRNSKAEEAGYIDMAELGLLVDKKTALKMHNLEEEKKSSFCKN